MEGHLLFSILIYYFPALKSHSCGMVTSLSALCFLFALALSSSLPLCVLACVCTVRYCGNTSSLRKKERGSVAKWGPILCIQFESVREKEGEKNYRAGSERVVYSSDSQDTERDASNEKSHLNCLLFSHTPSSHRHALNSAFLRIA